MSYAEGLGVEARPGPPSYSRTWFAECAGPERERVPGGALRAWRTDRERHPSNPARDEGPLWLSRRGQRLSMRSISKLVAGVMAAAGVQESAHGLRHTVATRLVREHRRDLVLVADILGHADVKTTRRYARSELEDRRAALEELDRG